MRVRGFQLIFRDCRSYRRCGHRLGLCTDHSFVGWRIQMGESQTLWQPPSPLSAREVEAAESGGALWSRQRRQRRGY
jgi:hypothetical protein